MVFEKIGREGYDGKIMDQPQKGDENSKLEDFVNHEVGYRKV